MLFINCWEPPLGHLPMSKGLFIALLVIGALLRASDIENGNVFHLTVGKIFAHQKYTTGKKIAPNCLIYTPGVGISSKQLHRNVIEFTYLIYMA